MVEKDFEGFKRLFGKFVNETGPSVNWDKIERLPEGAVSTLCATTVPSVFTLVLYRNYEV